MSKSNTPDEESPYSLGRDQLWLIANGTQPELIWNADELIHDLLMNGAELPDHCLKLRGGKISKLVLTFGRHTTPPFSPHYEVGFYDGAIFRGLDGYRIYPDPTHWIPLPKPPRSA